MMGSLWVRDYVLTNTYITLSNSTAYYTYYAQYICFAVFATAKVHQTVCLLMHN